jgi:hypothetical protein
MFLFEVILVTNDAVRPYVGICRTKPSGYLGSGADLGKGLYFQDKGKLQFLFGGCRKMLFCAKIRRGD